MSERPKTVDYKAISLAMEVSGCACTCNHCANEGHPYPSMKLEDIERVLAQSAEFCRTHGLKFSTYPMHDFMMHRQPAQILRLFASYGCGIWHTVATTPGPVLALHREYEELLRVLKEHGTTMVWFAFHGLDDVHDRAVGMKGAFAKSMIALERVRGAGLRCGAAIYVSTDNLHQIPGMVELTGSGKLDCFDFYVASYCPHSRGRAYEAIRPEAAQLLPYAELLQISDSRAFWSDIERHTEAEYVNRALTYQQSDEARWAFDKWYDPNVITLVCRNNLDIHAGQAGLYGRFLGSVREDAVEKILEESLDAKPGCSENLYFPDLQKSEIPSVPELARRWGDPQSRKVYMTASEIRLRWLDRALGRRRKEQ